MIPNQCMPPRNSYRKLVLQRDVLTEYGVGPVKGLNWFWNSEYEVISGLVLPQHMGIY